VLCYVTLRYIMLCYVCYVVLCYFMLCYVMLGIRKENAMWEVIVQLKRIDSHVDGQFFLTNHAMKACVQMEV